MPNDTLPVFGNLPMGQFWDPATKKRVVVRPTPEFHRWNIEANSRLGGPSGSLDLTELNDVANGKREALYRSVNTPTTLTDVYTSTNRTRIDEVTAYQATGASVTYTLKIAGVTVFSDTIPTGVTTVINPTQEHGLSSGQAISVQAGAANVETLISGYDF